PAGDRGAVEHLAVLEQRVVHDRLGEGHVVLHAAHVGEAQVDPVDLVVADEFLDVVVGGHGRGSEGWGPGTGEGLPGWDARSVPSRGSTQAVDPGGVGPAWMHPCSAFWQGCTEVVQLRIHVI